MEDEPEVVFEADADAFAEAAELEDLFAGGVGEGRGCGAEEEWADDADGFQGLAENAFFERFNVNGDIREFRHAVSRLDNHVERREHRTTGAFWQRRGH